MTTLRSSEPSSSSERSEVKIEEREREWVWGDKLGQKGNGMVRIGFLNINGFPIQHDSKNLQLRQYITGCEFDVIGMAEINRCWAASNQSLQDTVREWFPIYQAVQEYNKQTLTRSSFLAGGVAQIVTGTTATRIFGFINDETGLGRWVGHSLRAKNNTNIHIITAYRPVLNMNNAGSVWNQQKAFFDKVDREGCPRQLIIDDIEKVIAQWNEAGDQVIVMIDANEHVVDGNFGRKMLDLGLREVVNFKHGAHHSYLRGSEPIDGIFVSSILLECQCGYTNPGFDHYGLWIDIPREILYGADNHWVPPRARRLRCNDPRIVRKYLQNLKRLIDWEQMENELLVCMNQSTPVKRVTRIWNSCDDKLTKARLEAERKCRKIRSGKVQWSPEFSRLALEKKFWVLLYKKGSKGNVDRKFLIRIAKSLNKDLNQQYQLEAIQSEIQAVNRRIKAYKRKHEHHRDSWLESLALAQAENTAKNQDDVRIRQLRILKQLRERETQRRNARIIKRVNAGVNRNGGIDRVMVPVDGVDQWIYNQEEIERLLLQENKNRFNQAGNCPFLQLPLSEAVGPIGLGVGATEILDGTFNTSGVDPFTNQLIDQMKKPKNWSEISVDESFEEYQRGWQRARENTSSGPSGIHFGHFIAATYDDDVGTIHWLMSKIAMKRGIAPARWRQGTQVMLLKQPGNYQPGKMRAILLYEADFNHANKLIGRMLMRHAEQNKWLAPEQYGSRKNLSAIEHCLNKRLACDILRQKKQPGGICVNDMKGCYDRIVHSVASLCMQRLGIPSSAIEMMFSTIQNLRHYVRTVFGDSISFFDANSVHPVAIQGVGQGNGAGPQIWAAISTVLLNMLRNRNIGARFESPLDHFVTQMGGFAFVDDTDLLVTADDSSTLIAKMTEAVRTWEGGINASGGQLEPSKTYWYPIDFDWVDGNWKYKDTSNIPGKITMKDADGQSIELEKVSPGEARRTLGVRLAPNGSNKQEAEYLQLMADQWAERIRIGHLPRFLAWQSLVSTITAKLCYALPATTLTEGQCRKITTKMTEAALFRSGFNRNYPRDLVFGHQKRLGLGMVDLYVAQGAANITALLRYADDRKSLTGQLIQTSYQQLLLEMGTNSLPFFSDFSKWKYSVTPSFLTHVWQFCNNKGITIKSPAASFRPRRIGDCLLMEQMYNTTSGKTLASLNQCRIYLQIIWLSEIVSGDGRRIRRQAVLGNREDTAYTPFLWPRQNRPSKGAWTEWQQWLKTTFGVAHGNEIVLGNPLGAWTTDHNSRWLVDPGTGRVFDKREMVEYGPVIKGKTRSGTRQFCSLGRCREIPFLATPATVFRTATGVALEGTSRILQRQDAQAPTLEQWILQQHNDWKWGSLSAPLDNGEEIATALQGGTCLAVSDGSFRRDRGTASTVIEGHNRKYNARADVWVSGPPEAQSAFRSELTGILATVLLVNSIAEYHSVGSGKIDFFCDGKSALTACFDEHQSTSCNKMHFDLINFVRKKIQQSNIKWNAVHVKGHQSGENKPREVVLNDEMDRACKEFMNNERAFDWSPEPWQVFVHGGKVVSCMTQSIQELLAIKRAEAYWEKKHGLRQAQNIDWSGIASVTRTAYKKRRWISKHACGFCAVGKMAVRMKLRESDACPRCGEPETAEHVWICMGDTNELWGKAMEDLQFHLQAMETDPEITQAILRGLNNWRSGEANNRAENGRATNAIKVQTELGWKPFFEGRVVKEWRSLQQQYLTKISSRRSGKRWLVALIEKMWQIAWDLWEHRNGILHGQENHLASEKLDKEITTVYHQARAQKISDIKGLVSIPLDTIMKWPVHQKQLWINRVGNASQRAQRLSGQSKYSAERQQMAKYLALFRRET